VCKRWFFFFGKGTGKVLHDRRFHISEVLLVGNSRSSGILFARIRSLSSTMAPSDAAYLYCCSNITPGENKGNPILNIHTLGRSISVLDVPDVTASLARLKSIARIFAPFLPSVLQRPSR
jgi:hypothetical protein